MTGKKGYLILENGQIFNGLFFSVPKDISGEVVFNTGMVGYPEGFTDPSYFGQILVMTYPLIGNYGVPAGKLIENLQQNWESEKIQIAGLIVSSYEENNNHWQSFVSLSHWLKKEGIPALFGVDTRTLTKIIREKGIMKGILTFSNPPKRRISFYDINKDNLVSHVSCSKPVIYGNGKFRIMLIDCGLKTSQIRLLLKHDVTVIRVPWNYSPFTNSDKQNKKIDFEALMISSGPGNPKMAKETILTVKEAVSRKIPVLGICLGHQILALAVGANTYKLKYGHRSQNQPVIDEISHKCFVTTQNHSFAVDNTTLPLGWQPWFTNLNDRTNEGIKHKKLPFVSVQFHPEAAPGPTDTEWIFEYFISFTKKWLKKN